MPFYTTLGQECVAAGCGVDLFLFPNAYIDIATVGEVCRLTGGDIYKYDYFTVSVVNVCWGVWVKVAFCLAKIGYKKCLQLVRAAESPGK